MQDCIMLKSENDLTQQNTVFSSNVTDHNFLGLKRCQIEQLARDKPAFYCSKSS